MSDATVAVFDAHTTGDYLTEAGFLHDNRFPRYEGTPPDRIREATDGNEANGSDGTTPSSVAVSASTTRI